MSLSDFASWVQIVTQISATLIAGIMAFLAWKTYLKEPYQEPEPPKPDDAEATKEPQKSLVVFDTKKQRTTLRATHLGLECHLLDKKKGQSEHRWTIGKPEFNQILKDGKISVNPGYKANVGLFNLGSKRGWLYSKKLFPEAIYLEDELKEIIKVTANHWQI